MTLDSQRERRTAHPGRRELFTLAKVLGGLSEPFAPANCRQSHDAENGKARLKDSLRWEPI
eukprot:250428-Amphidinium_carterae.3